MLLDRVKQKWNRRPWPSSLSELRALRISYSQFGEDLLATTLLGYEKVDGVYVDIGCYHPINFSNSYIFYRRGWRGVCIDPNPRCAAMWNRERPRDVFENVGVAEQGGQLHYFESDRYPACNKLSTSPDYDENSIFDRSYIVPVSPLAAILKRTALLRTSAIDLMSVDCEGLDLQVLRSNDFARYRPRVLIVEDHDESADSALARYCHALDYRLSCKCHLSRIYLDATSR
jgi:FkbM family methyltransferase